MSEESDGGDISLASRLMSRSGPGIHRRSMPDGGEVVSGPLATQALRALNARAFTMDHTIFVDEDFDPSTPEDAALYAHERHHQMESGGFDDGHSSHDSEEVAARAIERMVLHRSTRGDALSDIMSDVRAGNVPTSDSPAAKRLAGEPRENQGESPAEQAYRSLIALGQPHEQIVRDLTNFVVESLLSMEEEQSYRTTNASMF